MSAPKRMKASPETAASGDARREWLAAFRKSVRHDETARGAWKLLERAGLETTAQRAYWIYAHAPEAYVEREHGKVRQVNRKIKALIRSDRVVRQKHKGRDPRTVLFFDRSLEQYRDLVRSGMPFAGDGVTVGDWALSRAAAGKGMPD